jgi:hypothetical protein
MKLESFLRIIWYSVTDELNTFPDDLTIDISTKQLSLGNELEPIKISYSGLDLFIENYIDEVGDEILDTNTLKYISNYIKNQLKGPPLYHADGSMNSLLEMARWTKPTFGEFILVFNIEYMKNNHFQDPDEFDMVLTCKGVLGQHVQLNYLNN